MEKKVRKREVVKNVKEEEKEPYKLLIIVFNY